MTWQLSCQMFGIFLVSLGLFPRLLDASKEERDNWYLIAGGIGIHWPDLDEDIALRTLLELSG